MKSLLNKLPKGRITRWGFLAVLLVAAGATVAWMNQRHYQLGGCWSAECKEPSGSQSKHPWTRTAEPRRSSQFQTYLTLSCRLLIALLVLTPERRSLARWR